MEKKNKAWSLKDQEEFLIRMGNLYDNGYPMLDALELMIIHYKKDMKRDLLQAINALQDGYSIHKVLETLQFHEDVLSVLFFSQKHGKLGLAFKTAGSMLERKRYYRNKLVVILRYPIFMVMLVFIMLIFVQTVLLPQFQLLFTQMNITLSPTMSMFLTFLTQIPLIVMLGMFVSFLLLPSYRFFVKDISPIRKAALLMKIPLLNSFLSLHHSHYFTQQLSCLLGSGMTINDAVAVFEQQSYHPFFQEKAMEFRKRLVDGAKLEELVANERIFVEGLPVVVVHGQKNGKLAQELQDYSIILQGDIQEKAERVLSILQPSLFMGVGMFILMLYLAIFIPMFQILGGL
jgi:competence protein ComGB